MRLEVKAVIIGDFTIKETLVAKYHPYEFNISESEDGNFYISVSKKVIEYHDLITKYEGMYNGVPQISLTPFEAYEDMILWLQYIESMGSFNFAVEKIKWEEPKVTWIPEIEEEQGLMPLLSFEKHYEKNKSKKRLDQLSLSLLVTHRKFLKDTYIPFTYFRQAKNLLDQRQYYFSFINFFMMLEYCFANGKFKKEQVIKEFKDSYLLNKSLTSALQILRTGSQRHAKWLEGECKKRHKNLDNEGVIYVLVEYRGLLSHATKRSDKYLFNDSELFSIAFIASMICFLVCGNLQIGNSLFEKQKDEYLHGPKKEKV